MDGEYKSGAMSVLSEPLLSPNSENSTSSKQRKRRRRRVTAEDKVLLRAIEPGIWIGEYVATVVVLPMPSCLRLDMLWSHHPSIR